MLDQLTSAIATVKTNNKALVATNAKLAAEVTNLTRRLGPNAGSETSGTTADKRSPRTCPHCKKEGPHKPDIYLDLGKNSSKRPPN